MVTSVGKGSSKKHESIDLATTDESDAAVAVIDPDSLDLSAPEVQLTDKDFDQLATAIEAGVDLAGVNSAWTDKLAADLGGAGDTPEDEEEEEPLQGLEALEAILDDPNLTHAEKYAAMKEAADAHYGLIGDAVAGGASEEWQVSQIAALKHITSGWLKTLPEPVLQELAEAEGFEHPQLVGLSGSAQHPLVHWLDPAYSPTLNSKQAIQVKAIDRYQQLKAGIAVEFNGYTLADLEAPKPFTPTTAASIKFSPASVDELNAVAAQGAAAAALLKKTHWAPPTGEVVAAIQAGYKLAAASQSEDPEIADAALAAYQQWHEVITSDQIKPYLRSALRPHNAKNSPELSAFMEAEGLPSPDHARYLTQDERVALFTGVGVDSLGGVVEKANARFLDGVAFDAQNAPLKSVIAAVKAGEFDLTTTEGRAAFLANGKQLTDAHGHWSKVNSSEMSGVPGWQAHRPPNAPDAQSFRAHLKKTGMSDLRATAMQAGLPEDHALGATRAELQNYLMAHYGSYQPSHYTGALSPAEVASEITPKSEKKAKAKAAKAAAATAAAAAIGSPKVSPLAAPTSPPVAPSAKTSYRGKVLDLAAAIKAQANAIGDIPKRMPHKDFEAIPMTPTNPPGSVGGVHSKTWWTDPQGNVYMAKPDNVMGGARVEAESVASRIHDRLGVPTIPVYHRKLGGKQCATQPWVAGSKSLDGVPMNQLTQSDVDQIARASVSRWLMGDNDSKADNWLRTPSGSITPVDAGQAFKYYGSDKLDPNWSWSGAYSDKSMLVSLIEADKSGGLAPGVKVRPEAIIPALKAAEKMTDDEWRAMVRPVAEAGVGKSGVVWNDEMRKRAAAKHGVAAGSVTNAQIVDAFLDHAVERKNSLRAGFKSYFEKAGVDASVLGS